MGVTGPSVRLAEGVEGVHTGPPPETELRAGEMVGEYRVETKIGEGSFGIVYRAIHPVIGKNAAVKVLHRSFSISPEFVQRFVEEARAANRIRHRGIIDIFGFGALPDGRQYYVMEMLEGHTLDEHIRARGPLDPVEALPILRGIARAMDAAHAASIIHRDLKPENIFLVMDEDQIPKPKVLDFGIAKLLGDVSSPSKTSAGAPLGTPHYMSPEQCRGYEVDKATDVYAFGIIVFEMLTGTMPFSGETAMDLMMQHMADAPERPSTRRPGLSPDIDGPVLRMLAKAPQHRPASLTLAVEELANAAGFAWQLNGPRQGSVPPLVHSRRSPSIADASPNSTRQPDSTTGVSQVTAMLVNLATGEPVRGDGLADAATANLRSVAPNTVDQLGPTSTTMTGVGRSATGASSSEDSAKSRKMPLILAGAALVILVIGAVVYLAGKGPSGSVQATTNGVDSTHSTPSATVAPLPTAPGRGTAESTGAASAAGPSGLPGADPAAAQSGTATTPADGTKAAGVRPGTTITRPQAVPVRPAAPTTARRTTEIPESPY